MSLFLMNKEITQNDYFVNFDVLNNLGAQMGKLSLMK